MTSAADKPAVLGYVGFRLGQRPALDGLRGLAVVSVLLTHLHIISGGMVGVEALLTLSGFLITVLLIEEHCKQGTISLSNFYRKRFLRVLPPLVALIVLGSVISILIGFRDPLNMAKEAAITAAFLGNTQQITGIPMPVFGHTWTLALEVQFYLVWPILLAILLKANVRPNRILLLLAAGVVASMTWRIMLFTGRPPSGPDRREYLMRLFMLPDTHADTLLVGCLAGALVAWNRIPGSARFRYHLRNICMLSMLGLSYLGIRCHQEQYAFYCGLFTVTGVMVATVILGLVLSPPRFLTDVLESAPLTALGRISYALYLFHMPLSQWLHPQSLGDVVMVLALSLAAAVASFYLLEKPFIRAKRRAVTAVPQHQELPDRIAA